MPVTWRKTRKALVTVAILAVASGCGGSTTSGGAATTPPGTPGPASSVATSPATLGTMVTATLTEYKITLARTSFMPGRYTFVAQQKGRTSHALSIKGPGVAGVSTPTIQPGGPSQQLTVTLQPGSYELWCPVDAHREQGMATAITVQ